MTIGATHSSRYFNIFHLLVTYVQDNLLSVSIVQPSEKAYVVPFTDIYIVNILHFSTLFGYPTWSKQLFFVFNKKASLIVLITILPQPFFHLLTYQLGHTSLWQVSPAFSVVWSASPASNLWSHTCTHPPKLQYLSHSNILILYQIVLCLLMHDFPVPARPGTVSSLLLSLLVIPATSPLYLKYCGWLQLGVTLES